MATSKDLKEQVGSKVFFDLVDFEQARPSTPRSHTSGCVHHMQIAWAPAQFLQNRASV